MVREQNTISITADPSTDWVETKTLNSECGEIGKELLDSPVFYTNNTHGAAVRLYTEDQMLEMFRYGYSLFQTPYMFMHKMGVNDTVVFPIESWPSARSAASILKRQFGAVYRVEKIVLKQPAKHRFVVKVTRKA